MAGPCRSAAGTGLAALLLCAVPCAAPAPVPTESPTTGDPTIGPSTPPPTTSPTTHPSVSPSYSPTHSPSAGYQSLVKAPVGVSDALIGFAVLSGTPDAASLAFLFEHQCNKEGLLRQPPIVLHPARLKIAGSEWLGCLIVNSGIMLLVLALTIVVAVVLTRMDDDGNGVLSYSEVPDRLLSCPGFRLKPGDFLDTFAATRIPSVLIYIVATLYMGTVYACFRLLFTPEGDIPTSACLATAGGVAFVLVLIPIQFVRSAVDGVRVRGRVDYKKTLIAIQPRGRLRPWAHPLPRFKRFFLLMLGAGGDWVSCRRRDQWVAKYGSLIRRFHPAGARVGIAAEYLSMIALSVIFATHTRSYLRCGHVRMGGAALCLLNALFVMGADPYRCECDTAFQSSRLLLQCGAFAALAVESYREEAQGTGHSAADLLGWGAVFVATMRGVADVACQLYLLRTGRGRRQQRAEYREDAALEAAGRWRYAALHTGVAVLAIYVCSRIMCILEVQQMKIAAARGEAAVLLMDTLPIPPVEPPSTQGPCRLAVIAGQCRLAAVEDPTLRAKLLMDCAEDVAEQRQAEKERRARARRRWARSERQREREWKMTGAVGKMPPLPVPPEAQEPELEDCENKKDPDIEPFRRAAHTSARRCIKSHGLLSDAEEAARRRQERSGLCWLPLDSSNWRSKLLPGAHHSGARLGGFEPEGLAPETVDYMPLRPAGPRAREAAQRPPHRLDLVYASQSAAGTAAPGGRNSPISQLLPSLRPLPSGRSLLSPN